MKMLTPSEQAQLLMLQKKAKEPYVLLTDDEIAEIEQRVIDELEMAAQHRFPVVIDGWNQLAKWSGALMQDNARLLQEVRYWRSINIDESEK
jgi:hypothetical protein